MKIIRGNKKVLKIAAVLAAVLLTATIITAATAIQNQNQNTIPLINAYLMGFSPSPNNAIILPKMDVNSNITLNGGVYTETINVLASNIVIDGNGSTVQGFYPFGFGFNLNGRSYVTIYNVTVTGWDCGFYLYNSFNNNLTNNNANSTSTGFYLQSSSNNILSGNTANNNGYGFYLDSSSYNNLTNNTANNNTYDGFYLGGSSNNNILSGNNANNNNYYGFYLGGSNNNFIYQNDFENNTYNAVSDSSTNFWNSPSEITYVYNDKICTSYLGNYWSDYTGSDTNGDDIGDTPYIITGGAQDNYPLMQPFQNYLIPIYVWNDYTFTGDLVNQPVIVNGSNIVINGNGYTIQGPGVGVGCGFNLNGVTNVTIENITVTGWQYGFYLDSSSNNTLTGNTANNNTNTGFYLSYSSYNNLSSNTANNNYYYGFYLDHSSYNTLSGNTANNVTLYVGFFLYYSSYNTLSGNTADSNTYYGFYLYGSSYNTLSGNTANYNYYGFYLDGISNNNTLSGNIANSNNYRGFYLWWSSYNTLSGNTADSNTYYGFDLYISSNNDLSGNTANYNYYGFRLDSISDNNNLSNNTADNNPGVGFYLYSSNYNNLSGNTAYGNGDGFYLDRGSSSNNLSNNTATNNNYGFALCDSSNNNNLSGNTADSNTYENGIYGDGFCLNSSSYNILSDNTANKNGFGFHLNPGSNYNTLSDNNATNNWQAGFWLYSSSNNNLSGNIATNNHQGFTLADSSNNILLGNTANKNSIGFYLASSYNTLSGNTANNNDQGFYIIYGSYNTLSGNTANNNDVAGYYPWSSDGFFLWYSPYNNLSNNTANYNKCGFYLAYSSYNTLSGNTATNNTYHGFYLDYSSDNNILSGNTALNCNTGYYWSSDSSNNDFTGSVWANYLCVNITDPLGLPIPGAEINVETDGTPVYATPHFGGLNDTTDSNGLTPWIIVTYETGTGIDQMTLNTTNVTVYYAQLPFSNNSRTVSMSASHVETFQVETVTITSPSEGAILTNADVLLAWTSSDNTGVDHYAVRIDGGNWTSVGTSLSYNFFGLSDGSHTVDVRVFDLAGNNATTSVSFFVDTTPPSVTITSPTANELFNTTSVTVNWTGSDDTGIDHYEVILDSGSWTSVGTSLSHVFSVSNGTHTAYVRAFDLVGNSVTGSVSFNVDTTPPTVTITSPSGGAVLPTNVTVNWTGSDDTSIAYFEARIDGNIWVNVSTSLSHTFTGVSNGSHTVDVLAFDLAGNNATGSVSFNVDTTPPSVTITSPTANAMFNTTSVTVNWTGSDDTGIDHYEARIDSGSWGNMGTNTSYVFSSLSDGLHTIDVMAFDLAGNNATASVSFTVASVQPGQSQTMLLALLSLAGTQGGGTSPLVYVAIIGVVGVGVVAAGLFYYFRRVNA
ncbi:MAG: NosD domain-containing protein [Candidatus Freyarchaeum deiterrae]